MEGRQVVTSDAEELGAVLAEREDCVIVEMGHIFKTKHAIGDGERDGEIRFDAGAGGE